MMTIPQPYATRRLKTQLKMLEENTNEMATWWFRNNYMKSNRDKSYVIITNRSTLILFCKHKVYKHSKAEIPEKICMISA